MQGQLSNVNVPIQVTGAGKAQKQIAQVTAATNQAASAATNMGKSFGLALKRFAAFTVASRAVSLFTNTMANAVQEAIDFQRELIKISQVTGRSVQDLKGLNNEISRLSTTLGTSSKELLGATRILAQAGIQANDLKIALEALAKTTLAPTFEDINKTAEGAVAILAQFGKGVGALKEQLGAINAVAGQFAVESGDLIGAIRRTGGVFKATGGTLEEFLGLFTSIRATTRESAESIATGLRTILTRIQRPATIQYLKELGVNLTDAQGNFIGAYKAIERLSKALGDVPAGDLRFIQIAEELGGFRQIGKVIPLLQEFKTAEEARQAAVAGASSLDKDAATAQQALAVQIAKTKEEFMALIRSLTETTSFQVMVKTTLGLANAFIQVADALKPLLPLIGAFAAVKFAGGVANFGKGIGSAIKGVQGKAQGGKVMAFARGGVVPGTGSRDTVPAMLQPGEFVIRKSSVQKIGADNLANMNAKGYSKGGVVISGDLKEGTLGLFGLARGQQGQEAKSKSTTWSTVINNKKGGIKKLNDNFNLGLVGRGDKSESFNLLTGAEQQELLSGTKGGQKYLDAVKGTGVNFAAGSTVSSGKAADAYAKSLDGGKQQAAKNLSNVLQDIDVPGSDLPATAQLNFSGTMREMVLGQAPDSPADRASLMERVRTQVYAESARGMKDIISKLIKSKRGAIADVKSGVEPTIKFNRGAFAGHIKNLTRAPKEGGGTKYSSAVTSVAGFIQEGLVAGLTGAKVAGGGEFFDFPNLTQQRGQLGQLYGGDFSEMEAADAKPDTGTSNFSKNAKKLADSISANTGRFANKGLILDNLVANAVGMNKGGSVEDTVPAMLTPGEFVLNKKSAQSIGYSALNTMNKRGVAKFNKGGPVGFNFGGGVGAIADAEQSGVSTSTKVFLTAITAATAALQMLGNKGEDATDQEAALTIAGEKAIALGSGLFSTFKILQMYNKGVDKLFTSTKKATDAEEEKAQEASDGGGDVAAAVEAGLAQISVLQAGINQAQIIIKQGTFQKGGGDSGASGGAGGSEGHTRRYRGGPSSESFKSPSDELAYLNKRKSQQESVVAQREKNVADISQKKEKLEGEHANTVSQFSEEKARATKLREDREVQLADEQTKAKEKDKAANKSAAINDQVVKKEEAKVQADNELERAKAKDQRNRDNLQNQQEIQRTAEYRKSELERKQASGGGRVKEMQDQQSVRSGQIAELEAKQEFLRHQGGRGKVANIEGGAINEKQLNAKQVDQELARLRGEFQSTSESIKKAEKSVDSYDDEIKAQDKIIKNSKKAQEGLGEAVSQSGQKVKEAEYKAAEAGDSLAKARIRGMSAEIDAEITANQHATSQKKLKETNQQLNASVQKANQLHQKGLASKAQHAKLTRDQATEETKLASSRTRLEAITNRQVTADQKVQATQTAAINKVRAKNNEEKKTSNLYTKLRGRLKNVNDSIMKGAVRFQKFSVDVNKSVRKIPLAGNKLAKFNSLIGRGLVTSLKYADTKVQKITRSLKELAKSKAGGAGGGLRGMAKGGLKALGFAGAAVNMVQQIGSTVSSGVAEYAARKEEQAIGSGDISTAGRAATSGALSEGLGRIFTLSGFVESITDRKGFVQGIAQSAANKRATAASAAATTRNDAAFEALEEGRVDNFGAIAADVGATSAAALAQIDKKTKSGFGVDEKTRREALKPIKEAERKVAEGIGGSVTSMEELMSQLDEMGDQTAYTRQELLQMAKTAFAVAEAQRALAKAQFDNLKVMSAFNRANLGVNKFINSLQTGSSTLADSIATVETAASNMNMGAEGSAALESIRKRVIEVAAGGDESTAQGQAINRQFSRAQAANDYMASIQGRVSNLDISQGSEAAAKQSLESALLAGVQDADIRKAISGQIAGMGDIRNKDLSSIITEITKNLGPLREGALSAAKALMQHEQTIVKLTQQRRQAELAYISAQRQAIDSQLQFAQTFEDFGGAKLTSDQKLSANIAKFNLGARDAGVQELRTGSVADIQAVAASIGTRLDQQQSIRSGGGFRGAEGVDADRIKESNAAINDLTKFIHSQIEATKKQIAVIEQRNKLEQDSINSLLKGDVSGFLEGQAASGAAAALRTGDAELASLFSPAAMAAGIEQLKAEGADTETLRKAGEIAATSVGLDARAGQTLTGTTDELNELRAQGQALAQTGAQVSQMMADSAMMEVAQAEMAIEQANVIFKNTMEKAGRAQERADAGLPLSKGGVVYANRGIFVPRGTDTVPAMLTPGEFVVNRAAVQRGNNLQILRAMNANGQTVNAGPNGAANLSSGGSVGYYNTGDIVQGLGGVFGQALPNLERAFSQFSSAVDKLSNTQIGVSINQPIDVNIRLLNDNILKVIDDRIKDAVLETVANEIPKYKSTQSGQSTKSTSLLST